MRKLYLGLDTSNYKTSAGLYCPEDGSFRACGKLLEVPLGTLGLRQSDALFQHVKQLPAQVKEACRELDGEIVAIGVSSRPRDLEDSYMPCFLAGLCVAQCLGAAMDVPVYEFSHQQGHLAAAAFSGGTTEFLRVEPSAERIIREDIMGGTRDISAGQLIDRVGVALEMPFPAGPYVEQAALQSDSRDFFRVKVQDCAFSLSGVQNQYEARIKAGERREDVCRFVLNTVAQTILKATKNARKAEKLPVLISGGVSVCSLVQEAFVKEPDLWFAQKGLGGDNAVGVAILASMR